MNDPGQPTFTAFTGTLRLANGGLETVMQGLRAWRAEHPGRPWVVVRDDTGQVTDLDPDQPLPPMAGPAVPEPAPPGGAPRGVRGRPRLGVVAREVTLLEAHWTWLKAQPGGASATLRRLVEAASHAPDPRETVRLAQARTARAMASLTGDLPGHREALRALQASDATAFRVHVRTWPPDLRDYIFRLAAPAFPGGMRA
ncbi:DUF2239 family protein [Mesoterricola sediminis]|uniref:DUF2239 family protein n=1 Tax=Mesoterricola sediminis TaxID=2927980 RepID=A0AA48HGZ6_9BACT|nr:DUF2239 family protein [Mesoterricola sediminis]BDU78048.1 hypothetical protein METESE_30060 [Mesoterricola sediminis]